MPQVYPVCAARALHGSLPDGEDHTIAAGQWDDFGARLHARALLGNDEFAASEIEAGLGEQEGSLQREDKFAIHVLVQAIVVTGAVCEEQGRGLVLPCAVATLQESAVLRWESLGETHAFVPLIGDGRQVGVELLAQGSHDRRERIAEILIFSASEAMAGHHYPAAEDAVIGVAFN